MAGEIEALGGMATAGLVAQALDGPSQPVGDATHGHCKNCGRTLHGHFCSHCGQHSEIHRSISHIGEELLHGITHFDGKAWQTLPALVFKPGRLTYDYVHGKRARYIAPMAMFLFTVFLMFFVFGFLGGPTIDDMANQDGAIVIGKRDERIADAQQAVNKARASAANAAASPAARAAQQAVLDAASRTLAAARKAGQPAGGPAHPRQSWQERLRDGVRSGEIKIDSSIPSVDANLRKAFENPDFTLYRIQEKAYKLSFLLVPLSVPALWLMFAWRRDVRTFDHFVFALYSLSFMSLLVILAVLLDKAGRVLPFIASVSGLLFFVPPVHMFAQLKGAYRLGWGGALVRTVLLVGASIVILVLFAGLIIVAGLAD